MELCKELPEDDVILDLLEELWGVYRKIVGQHYTACGQKVMYATLYKEAQAL